VHLLLLLALLLLLVLGPQWWVRWVLARYHRKELDVPGTAGELARHLLDRFHLGEVKVEIAREVGDHYDPIDRAVRLTADKIDARTLTAVTTAVHEVGHAIQHGVRYGPFLWRMRLAGIAQTAERVGSFLLFAAPMVALLTRTPMSGAVMVLGAVSTIGVGIVLQLLTLPVEWDASFNRALPILGSGYVEKAQMPAARRILRACAFTYVASSLAGLLNFWRWMRLVGR
jgi:Zn-dependent membrane protease YugP